MSRHEDIDECYASERDLGDFFSSIGSMRIDSAHEQGLQVRMLRESPDIIASHPRLWRDLYPSTLLVGYKDFVRRRWSERWVLSGVSQEVFPNGEGGCLTWPGMARHNFT